MVGPQENAREERAPDQSPGLDDNANDQRHSEADQDDFGQVDRQSGSGEPVEALRLCIERDLRRNADDDQRGSQHQRSNDDLAGERQPSEGRAEAGPRAGSESGLHDPNDQSESGEVKPAAKKVREGRFGGGIEQDAVCDANGEPTDQRRSKVSPPMRGLSQKDRLADPGFDGARELGRRKSPDLMIQTRRHGTMLSLRRRVADRSLRRKPSTSC